MGDRLPEIKHRRKSGIPLWPHEEEWLISEIERLQEAVHELKDVVSEVEGESGQLRDDLLYAAPMMLKEHDEGKRRAEARGDER